MTGYQLNPSITSGGSQYGTISIKDGNTYDDNAVLAWVDSSIALNLYSKHKVGVQNGNLERMFGEEK